MTGDRRVCGTRFSIWLDCIELRNWTNQFEIILSSLILERTLKTVLFYKKTVLIENHVHRKSKSCKLTIYLYRYYEHEAPISCNTTIYLSDTMYLSKFTEWYSEGLSPSFQKHFFQTFFLRGIHFLFTLQILNIFDIFSWLLFVSVQYQCLGISLIVNHLIFQATKYLNETSGVNFLFRYIGRD